MSDWLSPILVKELRQGMRARVFEGAFILLQVCMVIAVSIAVMATASNKGNEAASAAEVLFWSMIAIPVVLVMPLRGTGALRSEIDGRTLELIFLTRLSAWRIVFGKWAALFSQTLLLVVAVLPYVVLRYFLGGTEVVRELLVIACMIGASALLTAFTVTGSAYPSKLARALVIILPLILLYGGSIVLSVALGALGGSPRRGAYPSLMVFVAVIFYGLLAFFFMLETAAGRIAPPAENHAVRKRMLGVLLVLSGPLALALGAAEELLFLHMVLVTPVLVDALCSAYRPLPGHRRPLLRFGLAGRAVAPLLLPGWPSGFLYTMLIFGISAFLLFVTGQLDSIEPVTACVAGLGALLLPLALVLLVRPNTERLGTFYVAFQLAVVIATVFTFLVNELFDFEGILPFLSVSPLSTLFMVITDKTDAFWLTPTSVVTAGAVAIITKRFIQLRFMEKAASASRKTPTAETPAP